MGESMQACNNLVSKFEAVVANPVIDESKIYYTGVDLGTACVVLVVMNSEYEPVAGAYEYSDVVKDGMIVDYFGAITLVKKLKKKLEDLLDTELVYSSAAIPPDTESLDGGAIKNVIQSAGFEITSILDEPTAANNVLNIKNGAIVDIGGGTTGISILNNGKVVKISDEATGGTHLTLTIAGAMSTSFEDAELYKRNKDNHKELLPILKPVIEKISTIITTQVAGYDVKDLYLVGGTACLSGIEKIIEKKTGITTHKPINPMFVTPLGIAKSCTNEVID
ncbi:ethanolamine utilization protein EutJ [Companilactobacillus paralimentarius DSM 13238 = JCM 10415]|uniref:Chaperone protein DnaK n=1 Tax=Companilactobacillus paralimentarius DSM 13238 = JCM 10415 TaxID=1122151 RepID=A0A0R1PH51_9LACO|nr:ethanolamine utilization protein EutJ [Companilactobacillus paralimentarius]KAE9564697.1 ethanolamine utilization protein EutJ [Companilactobacillus paralimentarius]KRL29860.1 ethanolamine utilization protein EutJ [Companilactobacillus paralimentarius DSM 13238 = JCM 10415]MDR4932623.1 ethanolamine utilization protein EutJ [Companilactobacillus paralimentarius]QFR69205.1 ethanolamine utilization protein EutJ [Companilactobacillus paralimentarius]